jgi:hypothetical protein
MSLSDPEWTGYELTILEACIIARMTWRQMTERLPGRSAKGCQNKAHKMGWLSRSNAHGPLEPIPEIRTAPPELEQAVETLRRYALPVRAMETVLRPKRIPARYDMSTTFKVGDIEDVPAEQIIEMANRLSHASAGCVG